MNPVQQKSKPVKSSAASDVYKGQPTGGSWSKVIVDVSISNYFEFVYGNKTALK